MLIVNADDLGRNSVATDRILQCHSEGRVTCASAMVFMEDSERAASLAKTNQLEVGLHINFTESFTGSSVPASLRSAHERIRKFLRRSKYAPVLYNPFLRRAFRDVFEQQMQEFARLYGRTASRFDGHQHMHLASNMVIDHPIPAGAKVRRSFSFSAGERNVVNRLYRAAVDRRLAARYRIGDFFFAFSKHLPLARLCRVIELARTHEVELMTHPELDTEFNSLLSPEFAQVSAPAQFAKA